MIIQDNVSPPGLPAGMHILPRPFFGASSLGAGFAAPPPLGPKKERMSGIVVGGAEAGCQCFSVSEDELGAGTSLREARQLVVGGQAIDVGRFSMLLLPSTRGR